MSQKTALNRVHHFLQARVVDFCGWEMPLNYGSQIEEHLAVRRACGMFDISHMCTVDITGPDARAFLLRLIANNVTKLRQPGKALYSCMLNASGGVLDDMIVYYLDDTHYRVVVNACTAPKDLAWMTDRSAEWQLNLAIIPRTDLAIIAVQGPEAREKVWQALPDYHAATAELAPFYAVPCGEIFIARTGYTGEDGFEIILPGEQAEPLWNALLQHGVQPCGLGARDTLRLEAGMNLYGQDMDEAISPLDAGLAWTVDLAAERDFVGKSALLARSRQWQFAGLVLSGGGILRAHQPITTARGEGVITSGSFSPTMQQAIALARIPLGLATDDMADVEIRGKRLAVRIVKLPFVRNGRILV